MHNQACSCPIHTKKIPFPNERRFPKNAHNFTYQKQRHPQPPKNEPTSEPATTETPSAATKEKKVLFSIAGFDICMDDLILIGLLLFFFLNKSKSKDKDCAKSTDHDKKGLFGGLGNLFQNLLNDDILIILALGYLLFDGFTDQN